MYRGQVGHECPDGKVPAEQTPQDLSISAMYSTGGGVSQSLYIPVGEQSQAVSIMEEETLVGAFYTLPTSTHGSVEGFVSSLSLNLGRLCQCSFMGLRHWGP